MSISIIQQPSGSFRLGSFLQESLANHEWEEFRAAIAFVKYSGTKHIRSALDAFSRRAKVRLSVGIDAGGTSAEGLNDLLKAIDNRGDILVFKNANSSTFHPKVYLFKNPKAANLVVGSGNLTEGGLFTNYEASLKVSLDLGNPDHVSLLAEVEAMLDGWCNLQEGLCYRLNEELLDRLVKEGLVPSEAQAKEAEEGRRESAKGDGGFSLFKRVSVPAAPVVKKAEVPAGLPDKAFEEEEEGIEEEGLEVEIPKQAPPQDGHHKVFLMTLQRTDVGVGQTTKGTSRRSPEIFIPLISRDYDPKFWGWPDLFVPDPEWTGPLDRDGRGKMDRPGVMVRLGGATFPVHMWYNPDKRDLRLRSEYMRSAGMIGDILYVERSDGTGGFSYYVDVVPQGSPKHTEYLAKCTNSVRNSKKLWGYI